MQIEYGNTEPSESIVNGVPTSNENNEQRNNDPPDKHDHEHLNASLDTA